MIGRARVLNGPIDNPLGARHICAAKTGDYAGHEETNEQEGPGGAPRDAAIAAMLAATWCGRCVRLQKRLATGERSSPTKRDGLDSVICLSEWWAESRRVRRPMRRRHSARERAKRRKLRRVDLTPIVLERSAERQTLKIATMTPRVIAQL